MSDITTQKCDGDNCKKLRVNDANHWLVGWVKAGVIHLSLMDNGERAQYVTEEKHFCGEQCAMRWFVMEVSKLRE